MARNLKMEHDQKVAEEMKPELDFPNPPVQDQQIELVTMEQLILAKLDLIIAQNKALEEKMVEGFKQIGVEFK